MSAPADDRARRQVYCREWLTAYKGTEPLFVAIRQIATEKPRWELPLPVVTAIVRFSADEVWKSDPVLERVIAKALAPHHRSGGRELVTSDLAVTPQQRSRVRAQAISGYARNSRRGRRR